MKLAFIGDIVGKPGRRAVVHSVARIREEFAADVVIANAENSAAGFGINMKGIDELSRAGVDFFTTGNHVWDRVDGIPALDREDIVRPGNFPGDSPGRGWALVPGTDGAVAVLNVQGRVFMPSLDCPFRCVDAMLAALPESARVILVDVHAEATSEKIAMGWYLDGRVTAVVGTHTHVPTADHRVLPGGTAYVTDVGMTGPYDGILGVRKEAVINRFLNMRPTRFEVARDDVRLDLVVIEVDEQGRALSIEHPQLKMEE